MNMMNMIYLLFIVSLFCSFPAAFQVREDFFMYHGGVYGYTDLTKYEPDNYKRNGWHSVRILGWGIDKTNPSNERRYWVSSYRIFESINSLLRKLKTKR